MEERRKTRNGGKLLKKSWRYIDWTLADVIWGKRLSCCAKKKNPDQIPEVPLDVDDPKFAGELSQNERSHQVGLNGTFNREFEFIIDSTQSIFKVMSTLICVEKVQWLRQSGLGRVIRI